MTNAQAKEILALYRPNSADASDPEVAEALEQVRRDPELREWFQRSQRFHQSVREKFRDIPVPAGLKETILAHNRIIRPVWWQRPVLLAAAAAVVLFVSFAATWLHPRPRNLFSDYQARMLRTASRPYRMEIVTNDLTEVRRFLAQRGAPADYSVPNSLQKLALTGGAALKWHGNPVSMVCFDRGDSKMLFFFVVSRAALSDAPPGKPQREKANKLVTRSWTEGDKTYMLAGPEDSAVLQAP